MRVVIDNGKPAAHPTALEIGDLIAHDLRDILQGAGVSVHYIDATTPLKERLLQAESVRGDVYLSIGIGVVFSLGVNGPKNGITLWANDFHFGQLILDNLAFAPMIRTNGGHAKNGSRLYLLKHQSRPAAMVECGYLTDIFDKQVLCSPDSRRALACALSRGILAWGS